MDDLLPKRNEELVYIGSKHNFTLGKYYTVLRKDYSVVTAYSICVIDDNEQECWVDLTEFSLIDDNYIDD